MVRPAEGFVADDGTFFEREELCESYEATKNITIAIITMLHRYNVYLTPDLEKTVISGIVLASLRDNAKLVRRYLDCHDPNVEALEPARGANAIGDLFVAKAQRDQADNITHDDPEIPF